MQRVPVHHRIIGACIHQVVIVLCDTVQSGLIDSLVR